MSLIFRSRLEEDKARELLDKEREKEREKSVDREMEREAALRAADRDRRLSLDRSHERSHERSLRESTDRDHHSRSLDRLSADHERRRDIER